jgi:peptide-methionine (S)-S-oxide reductase
VRVVFDPSQISYGQLLRIFFSVATDPTQLNAQYPDQGTQYRNEIFYTNADQKRVALAYIAQLDGAHAFKSRIVTRVDPLTAFYNAEAYHQDYLTLHPESSYIRSYDLPKIADLRKSFPRFYRASPVLVGKQG